MATSLGEGIALQTPKLPDNSWMKGITNAELRGNKERANSAISKLDFKKDYSTYYPDIADAIADKQIEIYRKYEQYRKENPNTAINRILIDAELAKRDVGELEMTNQRWKAYETGQGFKKRPEIVDRFYKNNGTLDDLKQFDDGVLHRFGEKGQFTFVPVPDKAIPVKYDTNVDMVKGQLTGNMKRVGRLESYEQQDILNDSAVKREAEQLSANPDFIKQVMWDDTEFFKPRQGETKEDFIKRTAERTKQAGYLVADAQKPVGATSWTEYVIPQPRATRESDKDKRFVPTIQENVDFTRADGRTSKAFALINTPDVKETSLQLSPEFLDENDVPIKESGVINFTNKSVGVFPHTDSEGNVTMKLYGLGKAQKQVVDEDGNKIMKEIEYKVPYERIADVVESKVVMDNMKELYNRKYSNVSGKINLATAPPQARAKSFLQKAGEFFGMGESEGEYEIKGQKYTKEKLIEMGYSEEDIAPYKK